MTSISNAKINASASQINAAQDAKTAFSKSHANYSTADASATFARKDYIKSLSEKKGTSISFKDGELVVSTDSKLLAQLLNGSPDSQNSSNAGNLKNLQDNIGKSLFLEKITR